jgi:hypothetical protein
LLHWTGIQRRTPARDLEDFRNGRTLQVVLFTQSIGGAALMSVGKGKQVPRLKSGLLHLAHGQAPVWHDRRSGGSAVLHAPFELAPHGKKLKLAPKFDRFELATADGVFDMAVPKKDVPLVRFALKEDASQEAGA